MKDSVRYGATENELKEWQVPATGAPGCQNYYDGARLTDTTMGLWA
jgi:hypothetical protein